MIIESFQPDHIDLLIAQGVQPQQLAEVSLLSGSYASRPRIPGPAMTARAGDMILLCGGVVPRWPGVGELWALLSKDAGRHFVSLTRRTREFLDATDFRRIEVTAQEGFKQGPRWLKLLGFEFEGTMKGFGPNGETHLRYARVRCPQPRMH